MVTGRQTRIVGFIGRLAPEKHVDRLTGLAASGAMRLVIVGRRHRPEQDLQSTQCPQRFSPEHGMAKSSPKAYASMDVFVHSGEHETFCCQVVQEALAWGYR